MLHRAGVMAVAVIAVLAVGMPGVATARAGNRIGPDQRFRALVNGHLGYSAPVAIRMACSGTVQPGQTGHPMAGQTVKVVLRAATAPRDGFTGANATSIEAFFGPPPPAAATSAGPVSFGRVGVAKRIPTALVLPCSGTGQVTFVPLPMSPPTSRPAVVPISYLAQVTSV